MILVVTLGTLPLIVLVDLYLPVISAYMAEVRLGVKLPILNVVVDKPNQRLQGLHIPAQVGHLHIGDGASQRLVLEIALKSKFCKGVHGLPHVHMVRVGVIALVGHIGNVPKFFPVYSGKTITEGLRRSAVEAESNPRLLPPPGGGILQPVHDPKGKFLSFRSGVAASFHQPGQLIETDVPQGHGGVAAF